MRIDVMLPIIALGVCSSLRAAEPGNTPAAPPITAQAPADLPGRGLAQHPFFYAGEDKIQRLIIVRDGAIAWSHTMPDSKGEISDAMLRPNGHILFAHQFGVTEIDADKHVVWHLDAPTGCEIHTAQALGDDQVMYVQNGDPALLKVVSKSSGATILSLPLPVKNPKNVHGHFRHARMIAAGTFLVAHMDLKMVSEYDRSGKTVWTIALDGTPWSAARLANGNTLIALTRNQVIEVDHDGKTVWEFSQADVPAYRMSSTQLATRLANGNTLINLWFNPWSGKVDLANAPVQALEVTPAKQVVWALRSWQPPCNLGPATTIQLLDEPANVDEIATGITP